MVLAGDFHGHGTALLAGKLTASGQTTIGPFKSFRGENRAVLDDNGLADVQAGDFFGDAKAELDVGSLAGG